MIDGSAVTASQLELRGDGGNDDLRGGSKADYLVGGDGDDVLRGSGGDKEGLSDISRSRVIATRRLTRRYCAGPRRDHGNI